MTVSSNRVWWTGGLDRVPLRSGSSMSPVKRWRWWPWPHPLVPIRARRPQWTLQTRLHIGAGVHKLYDVGMKSTADALRHVAASSFLTDILSDYRSQSLNRDVWRACMLMNRYISSYSHLHHYLNTNYGLHDSKAIICFLLDMHLSSFLFPPHTFSL